MKHKRTSSKHGKSSRRKGVDGEQAWVKRLNIMLPKHAPFARDWLHSRQKQSRGDIVSTQEKRISDFYIEVKHRTSMTNGNIRKWFTEARKSARNIGRVHVLLCVHQTAGPWLVFTDLPNPERDGTTWLPKKADLIIIPMRLG